ncbi:SDR family oxidoreductase [Martelella radicis]|nr:aldehyde reductase [Martelella radicis]
MSKVLVTGGTGFLGAHILVQLLNEGHDARATIRNMDKKDKLLKMLQAGGARSEALQLFEADLEDDNGWADAMADCDYVLHVASPFPAGSPDDEGALIRPARDGTIRVLQAARAAGVKRVVMTSSFAAIGYGHPSRREAFTETDWSNLDAPDVSAYIKSKILAERAAWKFTELEGKAAELSVINPTGIFGPVLGPDYASSISLIDAMLEGRMPFAPRIFFGVVDVRDVAALHLLAMNAPEAAGRRFIAASGEPVSMIAVAQILRSYLGPEAAKAPRRQLPDWVFKAMARFSPSLRELTPQLGKFRRASNTKAREMLGWSPRSAEETILATARSLLELRS